MSTVPQTPQECANYLLAQLPDEDYRLLVPHFEIIPTPLNMVLFERGKPLRYAYFPLDGQHSILAPMKDGATVEVGTVGFEGFTTVDLLTGGDIASESTVCQVPGEALRMPTAAFREQITRNGALLHVTLRYFQAYLAQVSQSVACNALHNLDQRFARWVLMGYNRARGKPYKMTQEYLASMLGVQRPSVSVIAKKYQDAGLIQYHRGVISILDREGLEAMTCECYHVVMEQFERFIGKKIA